MPTPLTWHEGWALGIEELDADHREMLRLLNLLFAAGQPSDAADATAPEGTLVPGADPLGAIERLDAVLKHLRAHFEREEVFLKSIDYPQLEEHSGEHALEMAELTELRRDLANGQAPRLDEESAAAIKRWFFNHVIAEDQRYAEYYFERLRGEGH
jgi:hemerythrin